MAKAAKKAPTDPLQAALAKIRKDRGLRIGALSDAAEPVEGITTGNLTIDSLTGIGGLPRGRIVELYGPPSCGKTTTALQAAAAAQARGENVVYLDYEFAMDPVYCKSLGLDVDAETFLYSTPDTLEQGFGALKELVATGMVGVTIVDSVAAITTEAELKAESGRRFQDKPLLMAQAMRQLVQAFEKTGTCGIFLNHIQDVVDTSPMGQQLAARGVVRKTTPGGRALKFAASVRLEYKQIGNIRGSVLNPVTNEQEDIVSQTKVQVTVTKNKVGPPFRQAEVRVRFGKGFSQALSTINILVAYKIVRKEKGGVYRFTEETKAEWMDLEKKDWLRGEEDFASHLEKDEAWLEKLTAIARKAIEENITTLDEMEKAEIIKAEEDPELTDLLGARTEQEVKK